MSRSPALARRYAPFIAAAAVQLVLVLVVPSRPPVDLASRAGTDAGIATSGETTFDGSSLAADAEVPAADQPAAPSGEGTASVPSASGESAGDMSRCDADGLQMGPTFYRPPCRPVWPRGADNGGATMPGVTASTIRFTVHIATLDDQTSALLASQGLAATAQDTCRSLEAFTAAVNRRFELYGRRFVAVDGPGNHKGSTEQACNFPYYKSRCAIAPPDIPCYRAEAKQIASMGVAFVLAEVAPTEFHIELGKSGVMVTGANLPTADLLAKVGTLYPYFMDGTRAAMHIAEYWCKRLRGRPVAHAGSGVMNPDSNPATGPPTRKLGIIYPTDGYGVDVGGLVRTLVTGGACGNGDAVPSFTYTFDLNTMQQQAFTTAAAMKRENVTTALCVCDPIAPVFFTSAMDQQLYEPEHFIAGIVNTDYDLLARLYSQRQWQHAFGLSHLPTSEPLQASEAAKAWRDGGGQGDLPDATANAKWPLFSIMGIAFHSAGPQPTLATVRAGLFTWPGRGGFIGATGDQRYPLWRFGEAPDDYTAISDVREVFWDADRPSEVDGKAGSYQPVERGRRYRLGQWPDTEPRVFR